jgi:hypothetical protein
VRVPGILLRLKASHWGVVGILVVSTAFFLHAWWAQHPAGLMSVDDSGYSAMALVDWRSITEHGLPGFRDVMSVGAPNAPLVPFLAAPLTAMDPMGTAPVLVLIPFMWLLIVSSYSIYRRFAGPWAAVAGTVVTAFLPGVLSYGRLLQFALPLTAVLTAALAALLASQRLTSRKWSVVFGVLIGLALLTRTVVLAMVPGLMLAALVLAARRPLDKLWMRNLALAMVATAVVAGPWYITNFWAVGHYLVGAGYSPSSPFYVPTAPWLVRLAQIIGQDFLVPLTVVGLGIVVLASARRILVRDRSVQPTKASGELDPRLAIAVVAVAAGWYFLALSSSHNVGTGFTLPLAPLLVGLVLYAGRRLGRRQALAAGAVVMLVVAFNSGAALIPLGRSGVGDIPGAGDIGFVDGRSISDAQLAQALGVPGVPISDPKALGSALRQANCAIAARASFGPILTTRPDALLGGIQYCAEGVYRTQADVKAIACVQSDAACIARVIDQNKFQTIVTGDSRAPYPGYFPEAVVLPALTGYRISIEIEIAPGELVHVWVPREP